MDGKVTAAILIAILTVAASSPARCGDVSGTVSDLKGNPAANVQISAKDSSATPAVSALTDRSGHYVIGGLLPGAYSFVLDPRSSGFRGGDAVATLPSNGLIVDWKVSADATALAMAREAEIPGDPFGYTEGQFAALLLTGTGIVAGGVIGGYGAAGGFSGPSGSPAE